MRTKPYRNVARAKCVRCNEPAVCQWEGPCATRAHYGKITYHALCADCDYRMNRVTLEFIYGRERANEVMGSYDSRS